MLLTPPIESGSQLTWPLPLLLLGILALVAMVALNVAGAAWVVRHYRAASARIKAAVQYNEDSPAWSQHTGELGREADAAEREAVRRLGLPT